MALSNILRSEVADFSSSRSFALGCGLDPGDLGFGTDSVHSLNFSVNPALGVSDEDAPERKIEFLHGTTTLAFKVSLYIGQVKITTVSGFNRYELI